MMRVKQSSHTTQLHEYLVRDKDNDIVWQFQRILSHQGPLKPMHPDHNGSSYNVLVEWENGETIKKNHFKSSPKKNRLHVPSMQKTTDFLMKKAGNDSRQLQNT
jgi:hypothetical protein